MARFKDYDPTGVIPACLLPFHDDLSIDQVAYRKHLRDVATVDGITAVTVNAHASEVASCTFAEIGRIVGVPKFTAASRYRNGIAKLRRLMEGRP